MAFCEVNKEKEPQWFLNKELEDMVNKEKLYVRSLSRQYNKADKEKQKAILQKLEDFINTHQPPQQTKTEE